jgi:hypothetical protein
VVMKKTRAVFPNGRAYSTLLVGNGEAAITVFSWEDPLVERGDSVEVIGLFHLWRYNFRHVIESRGITRAGSSRLTVPEGATCDDRAVGPCPRSGLGPLSRAPGWLDAGSRPSFATSG